MKKIMYISMFMLFTGSAHAVSTSLPTGALPAQQLVKTSPARTVKGSFKLNKRLLAKQGVP
jgi:hypothetical protein